MEFGHVYEGLDEVDFTLPADTARTVKTLSNASSGRDLKIFVGASKWGHKNWVGKIYPPKTRDKDMLSLYSDNFNTVELGATFYVMPTSEDVSRWSQQVNSSPRFKFCPKFPQLITHYRRLANAEQQTEQFYQTIKPLGENLGPLLLQLGDNFSPKSFANLKSYLESLDPALQVCVEVRNKGWFSDPEARQQLFELFATLNIGTVITDSSGRRDVVHMELTTADAYIRFVGNNLHPSDYRRLDDWVERIKVWADQGLQTLYFFMHQNDEKHVPEACVYFIKQLNARLGSAVKSPILQNTLF